MFLAEEFTILCAKSEVWLNFRDQVSFQLNLRSQSVSKKNTLFYLVTAFQPSLKLLEKTQEKN